MIMGQLSLRQQNNEEIDWARSALKKGNEERWRKGTTNHSPILSDPPFLTGPGAFDMASY